MRDLTWTGDNIGLGGRETPIMIGLKDSDGQRYRVSLSKMLGVAYRINESGNQRLLQALPFCCLNGYMTTEDMSAWRAAEPHVFALLGAHAAESFLRISVTEDYLSQEVE